MANGSSSSRGTSTTQGAVPMEQPQISSHSIKTTQWASNNVGDRSSRHRRNQPRVPIVAFIIVAMAVAGTFIFWMTDQVFDGDEPAAVETGQQVEVNIPDGAGADQIAEILEDEGVIVSQAEFFKEVRNLGAETSMKSGTYTFVAGGNVREIVRQLTVGPNSDADTFTIPEGYTVSQIGDVVAEKIGLDKDEFMERAKASNYVNDYPFLARAIDRGDTLEGFLFPKTYDLGGKIKTPDTVIRMMLDQFVSETSGYDFDSEISKVNARYGLSFDEYDLITLASIIEREAITDDDRVKVASTFYNRLRDDYPLQSDATISYVTGRETVPEDNEMDSPYNSYLNEGLTPTPICNPSIKAIDAALHPADTNYYYFFIKEKDDLKFHEFSETYEQHQEVIDRWKAESE